MNWFEITNASEVDSPALAVFPDRIAHNINTMIKTVHGDTARLVPHVKTHKMAEVVKMQLNAGISRFKCATIAELEMCLMNGAKWVLMSYQLTGPKIDRFISLVKMYPDASISSLVDNFGSAMELSALFAKNKLRARVFLDVNNGMNRTGHPLDGQIFETYQKISSLGSLQMIGLHVYDGHIRKHAFEDRKKESDDALSPIYPLLEKIALSGLPKPEVITGGSPSFTSSAARADFYCSPGTTLLWDWGYSQIITEVPLNYAAVLMTRVISRPAVGLITTDLGHKSVAAENPIDRRVKFLNLENYEVIGQSEEHLVLKIKDWSAIHVGDILYAIPYHICPTVALYDTAQVVENNLRTGEWNIIARKRKINT